ncbi:MAG: DUF7594 domain-containing protein, partial [Gammaproteobacteria bacterium]
MRHKLYTYPVGGWLLALAALLGLFMIQVDRSDAAPVSITSAAFNPTDDAYVAGDLPANNFGTAVALQSDASPIRHTYLKFELQSLAGQSVLSAKLRMWVTNGSGGLQSIKAVSDNTWSEGTLDYSNAPAK